MSLSYEAHSNSLLVGCCSSSSLGSRLVGFMFGTMNLLLGYSFLLVFENLLIFALGLIIINVVEIIIEHLMQTVFFTRLALC